MPIRTINYIYWGQTFTFCHIKANIFFNFTVNKAGDLTSIIILFVSMSKSLTTWPETKSRYIMMRREMNDFRWLLKSAIYPPLQWISQLGEGGIDLKRMKRIRKTKWGWVSFHWGYPYFFIIMKNVSGEIFNMANSAQLN